MAVSVARNEPTADQRPYRPYGASEILFSERCREIVLAGPADTGKSRAALEKLHAAALKYPGMRGLILRKTRSSLTQSALMTFETKVLPVDWRRVIRFHHADQEYRYPNGSRIIVGGLDDTAKIMSTEYDVVYVQEAREATEDDWEMVSTRLRHGVMPYQQLIGDTNPDAPNHWLRLRANRGQLRMVEARHADNPTITPERLAILDALSGVRRSRLYLGLWVAAEGMIYEDAWDPARNLVAGADVPADWYRFISVDFGYTHPFVCQWWAIDPDGRLHRYRELHMTGRLVEDHAIQIRRLSAGENIQAAVCDHDAEDRATLEKHLNRADREDRRDWAARHGEGLPPPLLLRTTAAKKDVSPGLQAVAARLRSAGDGRPRLVLYRGALVETDPWAVEHNRPTCTEEEIEGYVWNDKVRKEEPVKVDDDGVDCVRYAVAAIDLVPSRKVMRLRWGSGQKSPAPATWNDVVEQRRLSRRSPRGAVAIGRVRNSR